jgi:hypothetical protein
MRMPSKESEAVKDIYVSWPEAWLKASSTTTRLGAT